MAISRHNILREAIRFRQLIQSCDSEKTELVTEDFPLMNCKLTSMILVYHFLKLYPELEIKGIGGVRPDNGLITHYWIEINGFVVDITGDQYNLIDDNELDGFLIALRPYSPIHVAKVEHSFLYDVFEISYVDTFTSGFSGMSESFIERLELSYIQLTTAEKCT
ncbi:hypothetical protein L8S09_18560 [Vibrio aestuarianus]|uniref:Microcin J25-processing protein McjB C-terminal domain-containing protein n=2 Tax=Vibrio aestuarianus TaxID=28171 RepID=A0ABM9FJD1_9VIBR|nr:hypothetical protein [Vibrio aestuarianus]MCU8382417.1 hypothetical protein [Vibrio vulnificus]CAH8228287.1 conserved hypothetical protein [Vibrio aestuarianus subsp. francensis]MDE1269714.1 hypothetical protein [Vibrio aestuarianus]MDH5866416.1 hypothetical protein [Vibrio aestuarianus]MDH5870011.1 hypothetical protein [Vibrio aestuarianus]